MKNFYYTLLFLSSSFFVSAQDSGGTPIQGLTPIKRISNIANDNLISTSKTSLTAKTQTTTIAPTGSSNEVGITEGELSVSLTGGANYSIPIAVPPGINGVVPQISLTYRSQGGNTISGYGWDISGISAITRIPSTKFHDGSIDPIDFDALDRFAFDGQRLVVKSGTSGVYGANGTVYETENFSNVKITSYGVHPSGANYGPEYFVVEYPDGSIAYYGQNQNQRSIMEWGITSWKNSQGIQIVYEYKQPDKTLIIDNIYYGGIAGGALINKIHFEYRTRLTPEQAYVGGIGFTNDKTLISINVFGNSVAYRNYDLLYRNTPKENYEELYKITEFNGDRSVRYNPTNFDYNRTNDRMKYLPITTDLSVGNINSLNAETVSGDFNGDGNMDFLLYPKTGSDTKKMYWFFSNINSGINIGYRHDIGAFDDLFPVSWLSWNNKLMPMQGWTAIKNDITGNTTTFSTYSAGSTNPIYFQYDKSYSFPLFKLDYYTTCGGIATQKNSTTLKIVDPIDPNEPTHIVFEKNIPKTFLNGDFNGDGLTDAIAIEKSMTYPYQSGCTTYTQTYTGGRSFFVNLDRRLTQNFVTISNSISSNDTSKFIVSDFNGDGKSDIYVFDSGYVKVYTLNDANQFILAYQNTTIDNTININLPILIGDYNGDGKSDFMIPSALNSNTWNKYTSTGTGVQKQSLTNNLSFSANTSDTTYNFIAADYNKDGKTDLIKTINKKDAATGKGSVVVLCFTNIAGWFSTYSGDIVSTTTSQESDINIYALPIFLSSNQSSIHNDAFTARFDIAFINQNRIHFFESDKDYNEDRLLTSVITGNGVTESITYQPLNRMYNEGYDVAYSPSSYIENYPNMDIEIAPNFRVVSKLEKQSSTVYMKRLFKYYGAVSNTEGLGFLGFRSTVSTNWHNDLTPIISNISKFDLTQRGANTENYTVLGSYSPLKTTSTQTSRLITKEGDYTVTGAEDLVATQRITLKPNTWIKPGSTFTAKINQDVNSTGDAPINFITKSILTYESDVLPNKVFKIQNTISKQYNGLENTNSETNIVYDGYNNPTQSTTVIKEGGATFQTAIVNVVFEDQTATSPYYVGRTKSKTQSVSVTGDTMTSQEDYLYTSDLLLKKVTKKGNNTPDSIVEDNTYDSFGNIITKTITAGSDSRFTSYTYDPTGRFLKTSTDIESLTTTYEPDPNTGVLLSETNPYGIKTIYEYDKWFKKTKTTDYLGKSKIFNYSRLNSINTLITATGSDDGSFSQEIYDDLGRKISSGIRDVTGALSNINYEYDLYNRNIKVSEPFYGTTTSDFNITGYDEYGRVNKKIPFKGRTSTISYNGLVTTINDGSKTKESVKSAIGTLVSVKDVLPAGGTINYTYFANGNLKSSNFDGVVTTITQDGWGRKKSIKDESAGLYSYDYNSFGEIINEATPTGSTSYSLDKYGRLQSKTISGPISSSVTTYNYDSLKRLISSEFNDGIKTNYTYGYDLTTKNVNSIIESNSTYNTTFTKNLFYDAWGRIGNETSTATIGSKSSSKTITNKYQNGFAWQILDGSTILWQTNTINARGQLINASLGNGIAITNDYEFGFIKTSKLDKSGGTVNVMTLSTTFDPIKGNLTDRTNSLFNNWSEHFDYDDLDRLTKYPNAIGQQEVQDYDMKGRITKNNLGTYGYDTVAPKTYQNNSIIYTPEAFGYYADREGIFNDSMEERMGWNKQAYNAPAISFDNTNAHTGNNSLKINTIGTGYEVSYVQSNKVVRIDNTTDTEYTFSGWVKSDSPTAQLTLFEYKENETGYYTKVESASTNTVGQWVQITKTVLVPANIKYLNLRVDNVGTGNVWFDDVQIRKTSIAATFDKRELAIDYNSFKSPVKIEEKGIDIINFAYNDGNQRSIMFYGNLDALPKDRPYRKYYSADGSMEIKENRVTNEMEFVTYIGGDGYSAPIALKSDGINPAKYLYLHRDYQGSIMAISNDAGAIVEKRLFDAWGNIISVQDGSGNPLGGLTILDRGYTGHEHLQSVGLINMNARLYDPKLHRFLQPDNFVQDITDSQNYNRYSYVLNNPLKYTDPSGEVTSPSNEDKPCPECAPNFIAAILNSLRDPANKEWLSKNLSARSIDKGASAIGQGVVNGINSIAKGIRSLFGGGGSSSSEPAPNMATNVNMNPYASSGSNYFGQNGFGQGGNLSPAQQATIKARNSNRFYGNQVLINSEHGSNNWSFMGVIHTSRDFYDGYKTRGLNSYEGLLLMHEYGHYLDSQYDSLRWYGYGMWSSMATRNDPNASSNWTEIQANTMSYYYYHMPSVFLKFKKDYPIDVNSISQELKIKLYYHRKL